MFSSTLRAIIAQQNLNRSKSRRYFTHNFARQLRIEPLEDRRLLSITVNTLVDENDGAGIGGISLRDAIAAASPGDTIDFAPSLTSGGPATINLTHGELLINKSLTISGPGANLLTIDASGNDPTPTEDNGDGTRVFMIDDTVIGQSAIAVSGLKLTGGDSPNDGGAIFNREKLTITSCTVVDNATQGYGGAVESLGQLTLSDCNILNNRSENTGGGIDNFSGALTVENSLISGNESKNEGGGAIYSDNGFTLSDSMISNNHSARNGGGILNVAGLTTVLNSTINDNGSATTGGGIFALGTLNISNSTINSNLAAIGGGIAVANGNLNATQVTISGNTASGNSGGIHLFRTNTVIRHSTVTQNYGGEFGGGVSILGGSLVLDQSIIASNTASFGQDIARLFGATLTPTYTLIGNNADSGLTEAPVGSPDSNGNIIGGSTNGTVDPKLDSLADNGGRTKTHALLSGSPAIDHGNPGAIGGSGTVPTYDQRGNPYVRVFGSRIDIGATERQTLALVVDTLSDLDDGDYSPGNLSLREAVRLTNGTRSLADTISFAAALTSSGPAVIQLSHGQLAISDSLTIVGPGQGLLTIDASGNDPTPSVKNSDGSRAFSIDDGSSGTTSTVEFRGLRLSGGDISGFGGAIYSLENVTIIDSTFVQNAASASGGAVYAKSVSVSGSTFTGNKALLGSGGGIYALGTSTIVASAIRSNTASAAGGVLVSGNSTVNLTINDSFIENNSAESYGGGIAFFGGALQMTRTTVSENSAITRMGGGIYSTGVAIGHSDVIVDSTITLNTAGGEGGGLYFGGGTHSLSNSTVSDNTAGQDSSEPGGGGGLLISGEFTITNSTITRNSGRQGGGIRAATGTIVSSRIDGNTARSDGGGGIDGGNITLINSTVSSNSSPHWGGGVYSINLAVINSTINGNSSNQGGGVYVWGDSQTASITNSTIDGNTASTSGGGIYSRGQFLSINHSTVTSNSAPSGSGSGIYMSGNVVVTPKLQSYSSIIAGNSNSDLDRGDANIQSNGYNLVGTGNAIGFFTAAGDQTGVTNPMLGPLADNGGPTFTHALLTGSPALDAGDPAAVAGSGAVPVNDQRSAPFTRVYGGQIDIGAVERQPIPGVVFGDYNQNGIVDAADYVLWRKLQGETGVTPFTQADGSGNGIVGQEDYGVWRTHFGETLPPPAAGSSAAEFVIAESMIELDAHVASIGETFPMHVAGSGAAEFVIAEPMVELGAKVAPLPAATVAKAFGATTSVRNRSEFPIFDTHAAHVDSAIRPHNRIDIFRVAKSTDNKLLAALAIDRMGRTSPRDFSVFDERPSKGQLENDPDLSRPALDDAWFDSLDTAFGSIGLNSA